MASDDATCSTNLRTAAIAELLPCNRSVGRVRKSDALGVFSSEFASVASNGFISLESSDGCD